MAAKRVKLHHTAVGRAYHLRNGYALRWSRRVTKWDIEIKATNYRYFGQQPLSLNGNLQETAEIDYIYCAITI